MMLKIDDLSDVRLIWRRRDAECDGLLNSFNIFIMIHHVLRWTVRSVLWSLHRCWLEIIRLCLAVFVIIIGTVVVAVRRCATRRTLLLISDYRFIDHCDSSVAATDSH